MNSEFEISRIPELSTNIAPAVVLTLFCLNVESFKESLPLTYNAPPKSQVLFSNIEFSIELAEFDSIR